MKLKLYLIQDKLKEVMQDKQKAFLAVLILIFFIYGDFSFLMKGQLSAIKKIGPKSLKLTADISSLEKDLANIKQMQNKQEQMQEQSKKAKEIATEGQVPALLEDISRMANQNNVKIMQIKPIREPKAKQAPKEFSSYSGLNITLDLSCGYHNLGKFVSDIENSKIFMSLLKLSVAQSADHSNHNVNMIIYTYVKK